MRASSTTRVLWLVAVVALLASALLFTTRRSASGRASVDQSSDSPRALANAMMRAMGAGTGHMPRTNWKTAAFWSERARNLVRPARMARTDWHAGVFWVGVLAAYHATGEEAFYAAARQWADRTNWQVGPASHELADRIAVGQAYSEMYAREKQPYMIRDLEAQFTQFDTGKARGRDVWWWSDALFMAPPVLAQLATVTGDRRYFEVLDSFYWDAKEHLFDTQYRLFFHNSRFFPERRTSPGGKPVFWGRGNGWVYAGLIRTLDALPPGYEQRQRYIDLFRSMTVPILEHQQPDGMWRSSLIEPKWVPAPESTSTALFAFGLLAGINRGYLDRETHLPHALRAWAGLSALQSADGGVRGAQPPSNAPHAFPADSVTAYGQGTFLLAASELYTMKRNLSELNGR